jgi:hypothetical protein
MRASGPSFGTGPPAETLSCITFPFDADLFALFARFFRHHARAPDNGKQISKVKRTSVPGQNRKF